MKALNRAIARTVSQIARHAGEGCHVPMIMALENHLDALLNMERKHLEQAGMKEATLAGNGTGQALPGVLVYGGARACHGTSYVVGGMGGGAGSQSLPGGGAGGQSLPGGGAGAVDVFASNLSALQQQLAEKATPLQPHDNDNAPPAPDVIDMNDPANWQEGDIVLRTGHDWLGFYQGREYRVAMVMPAIQEIYIARDGDGARTNYTFAMLREDRMFKWLRHGESEVAA